MFWCRRWVWETSFSALLLTSLFWLTLTMEDVEDLKPWLAFGLLWGLAALASTVLLAFLPASGLWTWYRRAQKCKPSLKGVVVAAAGFFACIAPWLVRNYRKFDKLHFIRADFGAEPCIGDSN